MPKKDMDTVGDDSTESTNDTGTMSPATKAIIAAAVILVVGAASTAGYFYKQFDNLKKNPNKVAQDETKATLDALGKLIVLPDEQPTLATVTDPEKLKDQPFFAKAEKGYKVLIFTNARKAILYNPVENKIVEVAPVNIGNNTADQTSVSGTSTEDESTDDSNE